MHWIPGKTRSELRTSALLSATVSLSEAVGETIALHPYTDALRARLRERPPHDLRRLVRLEIESSLGRPISLREAEPPVDPALESRAAVFLERAHAERKAAMLFLQEHLDEVWRHVFGLSRHGADSVVDAVGLRLLAAGAAGRPTDLERLLAPFGRGARRVMDAAEEAPGPAERALAAVGMRALHEPAGVDEDRPFAVIGLRVMADLFARVPGDVRKLVRKVVATDLPSRLCGVDGFALSEEEARAAMRVMAEVAEEIDPRESTSERES